MNGSDSDITNGHIVGMNMNGITSSRDMGSIYHITTLIKGITDKK